MKNIFAILFFLNFLLTFSQVNRNDTIRTENHPKDSISIQEIPTDQDVIADIEKVNAPQSKPKYSPTKAGLYSAVLPGLGQYYNKKYWKIPIAWGGIGAGVGIILWNQKRYTKYRNAFVAELNGVPHEFSDYNITNLKDALGRMQDTSKRQRDYAIAFTGLVYVLNIVDAVVDAHLYEGKNDPDLALKPTILYNEFGEQNAVAGLSLNYKF